MTNSSKMITKDFILLFIFSIAICTAMNMLNVIVPLYVTDTLKGNATIAGLMTTFYTVSACISRPINGVLTDKIGRRVMMAIGSLLFCASCFISGMIPAIAALTICRIVMGIGYSAASTSNNTASMDVIPADRMAEGIGYFGMSQSVASALGPAVAAVVMAAVGNQYSMIVVAMVCAVALIITAAIRYESRPGYQKPVTETKEQKGSFFEKTAIVPSLFQGIFLLLISCPMCFMPLYIVHLGFDSSLSGTFFLVASVVIVLVRLLGSGLMNRFGAVWFLIPGFASLIAICIMLPMVHSVFFLMICGVIYGLAHGIIWMILGSEAVRLAPAERRGAANATFYFAFDAGIGIGAAFWGMMIDNIGYNSCFLIIAVATTLLTILSIPVFRKRSRA